MLTDVGGITRENATNVRVVPAGSGEEYDLVRLRVKDRGDNRDVRKVTEQIGVCGDADILERMQSTHDPPA